MEIAFLNHSAIDPTTLDQIIGLKNQYWQYSKAQHLEWMQHNLDSNDYHILLKNDDKQLVAYLNLVVLEISVSDGSKANACGIGNVCVEKVNGRKGLGLLLMQVTNYFLKQRSAQGLLLCKEALVAFYAKAGWTVFEGDFTVSGSMPNAVLMSLSPIVGDEVSIDKNF